MNTETKSTNLSEWHNVTLRPVVDGRKSDSRIVNNALTAPVIPIAPPRRKRNFTHLKSGQPGGFKDVFGNLQRRASVDSAISIDRSTNMFVPHKRFNSSSDVANYGGPNLVNNETNRPRTHVGLKRQISKVGNRKSDKFFGENLSDCLSDDTSVQSNEIPDELDNFVSKNGIANSTLISEQPANESIEIRKDSIKILGENNSISNQNSKAEFLMAMLESHNRDEIRYMNQTPVVEPIIVPKRKIVKHICDDDEHVKYAINKQPKPSEESSVNNSHYHGVHGIDINEFSVVNGVSPKKPGRDMNKYKASNTYLAKQNSAMLIEPNRPVRRKSSLSREHLPKPPPTPVDIPSDLRTNENEENQRPNKEYPTTNTTEIRDSTIDTMSNATSMPADDKLDTILKKCNSSHSFLTPDLMDQIVNKVYGFKMNWDDHENVRDSSYDDGSAQVAPSSKLKTRKISVIRNKEPTEKPILEESVPKESTPTFSIGYSGELFDHEKPAFGTNEMINTEHAVANEALQNADDYKNIASTNEMIKTQELVTDETSKNDDGYKVVNDINQRPVYVDDTDDVLLVVSRTNDVFNNDNQSSVIKRSDTIIERPPPTQKLESTKSNVAHENHLDNIYARNKTILDQFQSSFTTPASSKANNNNVLSKCPSADNSCKTHNITTLESENDRRRASIDDHEQWFNLHKTDASSNESHKRNDQNPIQSYDTRKLFPFGRRERSYSESSEFFNDPESLSSSAEQLNDDELAAKLRCMMESDSSKNDHSLLLKFISAEQNESDIH